MFLIAVSTTMWIEFTREHFSDFIGYAAFPAFLLSEDQYQKRKIVASFQFRQKGALDC
jgi:hypothetical protein